jgi:hypothetical protein
MDARLKAEHDAVSDRAYYLGKTPAAAFKKATGNSRPPSMLDNQPPMAALRTSTIAL